MVLRATLVVLCIVLGLALFSSAEESGWIWGATVGVVVAGVALGIEYTLRRAKPGAVLGGAAGLACGLLLAGLAAWVLEITIPSVEVVPVLGFLFVAIFPYLGLIYGVKIFTAAGILGQPGAVETGGMASTSNKILDTSVIIDGRVADLCETGFLEGAFILPQFIRTSSNTSPIPPIRSSGGAAGAAWTCLTRFRRWWTSRCASSRRISPTSRK